jgi:hypothetical protein
MHAGPVRLVISGPSVSGHLFPLQSTLDLIDARHVRLQRLELRLRTVISGHQWSSVVISGHQ